MQNFLKSDDIIFSQLAPQGSFTAVTNPVNGEVIAYVKNTSKDELLTQIEKTQLAFEKWRKLVAVERADRLWNWFHAIKANKEMLAHIMTLEQGKSLAEARGEIDYAASFIRWFAEQCRRIDGDVLTSVKSDQKMMVLKQPIGVAAAITPWNFPSAMITRKAAPALACGCAMIIKPDLKTPLSAYALSMLAVGSGIEYDLMPIICGDAQMIGEVLCESEKVRKLSFTGSTAVGIHLYQQSAQTMKKLSLELGGNAPVIVFNDANLDKAAAGILASKFRNSGQTCVCANRIYVQAGVYDEIIKRITPKIAALKVGNGLDEGVNQGPLIDEKAVAKVKQHINDALNKGARVVVGGKEHALGGTFFAPTLLADVTSDMLISNEETFGPLCPLFKFETEDEVIKAANNTDFGLASYIFTENSARQWRVSEALEYGMVGVNTGLISNEVAPFGGVKFSGLGREGSKYGIDEYLSLKYMCLDISE